LYSNPGYDTHAKDGPPHPFNPPLTRDMKVGMMDFVVSEKIFNFFMHNQCLPGTKDHDLMKRIARWEGFTPPVAVWGYDGELASE